MTYRELLYKATRLINNNQITLGEYDEMTKPLDREIEQESILNKIRAEVITESYPEDEESSFCKIVYLKDVLDILDKYKAESEEE